MIPVSYLITFETAFQLQLYKQTLIYMWRPHLYKEKSDKELVFTPTEACEYFSVAKLVGASMTPLPL